MIEKNNFTQESFDALLNWLASDRDAAGQKYEKIRQRLIRLFTGRGCFMAEELTDETINRVMVKLPQITNAYVGEPALYFYGVADKVHLEWLREQRKINNLQLIDGDHYIPSEPESEIKHECLEDCLDTLSITQRELIIEYYQEEKSAKIKYRQELAKKSGINSNALQIKVCRLRLTLKNCIEKCLAQKN